jgi:hypothetical protein
MESCHFHLLAKKSQVSVPLNQSSSLSMILNQFTFSGPFTPEINIVFKHPAALPGHLICKYTQYHLQDLSCYLPITICWVLILVYKMTL